MKETLKSLLKLRRGSVKERAAAIAEEDRVAEVAAERPELEAALRTRAELDGALSALKKGDETEALAGAVREVRAALEALAEGGPPQGEGGFVTVRVLGVPDTACDVELVPLPQLPVQFHHGEALEEAVTDALGVARFPLPVGGKGGGYELVLQSPEGKPAARVTGKIPSDRSAAPVHVLRAGGGASMAGAAIAGRKVVEALAQSVSELKALEAAVMRDAEEEGEALRRALARVNADIQDLYRMERDDDR